MIRAVLDANIIVSGIVVPRGIPSRILDAAYARAFACYASSPIVAEVVRTLQRDRVQRKYHVTPADVERVSKFLESDLVKTPITTRVEGVATHPEDDLILATAVSARADYLATGDKRLRDLGAYQGIVIVSPREFLEILESE